MDHEKHLRTAGEYLDSKFSVFANCKKYRPSGEVNLAQLMDAIRSDRWKSTIGNLRRQQDKEKRNKIKTSKLESVKICGVFTGLRAQNLSKPSGLAVLDLDGKLSPADVVTIREQCSRDPATLAAFSSPTGGGVKIVVALHWQTAGDFKTAYLEAIRHFQSILGAYLAQDAKFDSLTSSPGSNCFLSWDPDAYLAPPEKTLLAFGGGDIDLRGDIVLLRRNLPDLRNHQGRDAPAVERDNFPAVETCVRTPVPPPGFSLPRFVETFIWRDFLQRIPHRAARRNATIVERVPILLNLVGEETAARLLLRWFDMAPGGCFRATRAEHWQETWAMIQGCLETWKKGAIPQGLLPKEHEAYTALRSPRQQATFRIARSLSLCKKNQNRCFYLSAGQLGQRLDCSCGQAGHVLGMLLRRGIIVELHPGEAWSRGKKPKATSYQWAFPNIAPGQTHR